MKKLSVFLGALFLVFSMIVQAQAVPLYPVSYDMINGGTGSYNYWDDSYTGTGSKTTDYASLSDGLGDLTDGVIAAQNWYVVEAPAGPGPYVGWDHGHDPTITFHFGQLVTIDTITFYVDDSYGAGGVDEPSSFTIAGTDYFVTDPVGSDPTSYSFSGLGITTEELEVTIWRSNAWIFMSEVEFEGTPIPEPATMLLLSSGLIGLAGFRRKWGTRGRSS